MTPSHWRPITASLAAGWVLVASCAGAPGRAVPAAPEPASAGPQRSSAGAMVDSTRHPYTRADVHFMSSMIAHHAQAVEMAGWASGHGASPAVRTLAERIVAGQQDEIATMQQWLRDRGQPVPGDEAGTKMMHGEHEMPMPGMLTEAQMRQLDRARGPEFDRLFLTFMIQHHRGAVSMVNDLFGSQGAAQDEAVFKLASDVAVEQSTEIARMERMLADLPSGTGSR